MSVHRYRSFTGASRSRSAGAPHWRFGAALAAALLSTALILPAAMPANGVSAKGLANSAWPMFRHDLARTGRSPYTGPVTPKLKWNAGIAVRDSSQAIGADGTIYVGSEDKKLYALRPDGTKKWEFATAGRIFASPAIDASGTVYVGSVDGKLYAINPDGTKKWAVALGEEVESSAAIGNDGTIYVGSHGRKLHALNPDGTTKWEFVVAQRIISSPAIAADGTLYAGCGIDGKFYAVNPDGTKKWEFATGDWITSSPAIGADGTVYLSGGDDKLHALRPDGTTKWEFAPGDGLTSSPAIGFDGTIYVGCANGKLYALRSDGTKKWEFGTGARIESSPAIGADGTIYFGSNDKKVRALSPTGKKEWELDVGAPIQSSPAIGADGTLYVAGLAIASVPTTPTLVKSPAGSSYTLTRKRGVAYWTFSATLKKPSGTPVPSKKVYLQRSANGTTWTTAYIHTTNSAGKVSRRLAFKVKGTTYWRWYSPVAAPYKVAASSKTRIATR